MSKSMFKLLELHKLKYDNVPKNLVDQESTVSKCHCQHKECTCQHEDGTPISKRKSVDMFSKKYDPLEDDPNDFDDSEDDLEYDSEDDLEDDSEDDSDLDSEDDPVAISKREWLKCVVEIDHGIDIDPTIRQYTKFKPCPWWNEELSEFYYGLYNQEIDFEQAIIFMSRYVFHIDVMDYAVEATFMAIIKALIVSCYRHDIRTNLHYFRYGKQWRMKVKFPECYNVRIKRKNRKHSITQCNLFDYIMDTGYDSYSVRCICDPELSYSIPTLYHNIATPYKWLKTETSDASHLLLALANTFGQKGAYKLVSLFSKKQILAISCKVNTRNNLIKLFKEFYDNYCVQCGVDKILNNTTLFTFHARMIYFECGRIHDNSKYDGLIDYVNNFQIETLVGQESVIRNQRASVVIFCTKNNKDNIDTITEVNPFTVTNFTTCCKDLFRLSKQVNTYNDIGIDLVIPCAKSVSILTAKERFIQDHIEVFNYFKWSEFDGSSSFEKDDVIVIPDSVTSQENVIVTPGYYIIIKVQAFFPDHELTNKEIEKRVVRPLNEYFDLQGSAAITYYKRIRINKKISGISGIVIPRTQGRVIPIPRIRDREIPIPQTE